MGVRRALLFFYDTSYAYILAEATRTLSLVDDSIQDIDDGIWLGHAKIRAYFLAPLQAVLLCLRSVLTACHSSRA